MEIRLTAIKAHRYGRRRMEPGDEYNAVSEKDARLLIAMGKARPVKAARPQAPKKHEPAPCPEPVSRPEKPPIVPRGTLKEKEKTTDTGKLKRTYKRRDMQAEE